MRQILNTLYVMTQGAYVRLDHETLRVEIEGATQLQVPLHHLGGVVCYGNVLVTPAVIHRCAEDGRSITLLDQHGRFKARVEGPVSGNVLLRRAQYEATLDETRTANIARNVVAGKIRNSRQIVLRGAREAEAASDVSSLRSAANSLANALSRLPRQATLDQIRGIEGEAARGYFGVFGAMVKTDKDSFAFNSRTRRPPRDRVNALLSLLYVLLTHDCAAAVEGVGMDSQVGFLHGIRPGRPSLALDVMEDLRSVLVDRLVLTLINRRQVQPDDFVERPGGAFQIEDQARKRVVAAYQSRKQEEVMHSAIDQRVPLGLVPHIQARLLARHLRGDLDEYLPFVYR